MLVMAAVGQCVADTGRCSTSMYLYVSVKPARATSLLRRRNGTTLEEDIVDQS